MKSVIKRWIRAGLERIPLISSIRRRSANIQLSIEELERRGQAHVRQLLLPARFQREPPFNRENFQGISEAPFFGRSFRESKEQWLSPVSIVTVYGGTVLTHRDPWGNHFYAVFGQNHKLLPILGTNLCPEHAAQAEKTPKALEIESVGWFLEWWATNHFHWLARILPKAFLLRQLCPDIPLLIPSCNLLDRVKRDSLVAVGATESAWLEADVTMPLRAKSITYVQADASDPRLQRDMRTQILTYLGFESCNARRRVYVSRESAKWRRIVNEPALIDMLCSLGFEVVKCELLSFADQVRIFSHAEIIVGAHGAGLANIMFSPEGSKVVEIAHPDWPSPDYYILAANLGHKYAIEFGAPSRTASPAYDDIRVDLACLRLTLVSLF